MGLAEASDASDNQTVLLIDEADRLLIDDLQEAPKNCRACIGFTATIPDHSQESCFEAMWLKHLKFEIRINFGYSETLKDIDCVIPNLAAFFDNSCSGSKLVWCNIEVSSEVKREAEARGFKVEIDCDNLDVIWFFIDSDVI